MYKDGFTHITSTDLSPVAIKAKQDRCAAMGLDGMTIAIADMFDLPFSDGKFDAVIEKGVMDVLFVNSGNPWNPSLKTKERVTAMLREAHRVLKPRGVFISIAFGQPHFRRPFFEAIGFSWSMQYATFGDNFHYFLYTLRKGTKKLDVASTLPPVEDKLAIADLVQEHMDNEDYLLSALIESD
ncbi:hypothetical protein O6H91_23G052900 [Diphasiastrum complanatum]|nr:hypothetical protein O6H91_23G052900 [Diphasiastrum complanatum]